MATAGEFREIADALDELQDVATTAYSLLFSTDDNIGLRGGPAVPVLLRGLGTTQMNLTTITRNCSSEAEEARRRAGVCDQYNIDLAAYDTQLTTWNERAADDTSAMPVAPARPAHWADAG